MFAESREPKLLAYIAVVNLTLHFRYRQHLQHVIFATGLADRQAHGEIPAFLVRIGSLKLAYGRDFGFLAGHDMIKIALNAEDESRFWGARWW